MGTWPEMFQDLGSFCSQDQDELNTPQITSQDEFNFNPDVPWGFIQSNDEVEINDQMINQDLLASPNVMIDEENNNYTLIDFQGNFSSFSESKSLIGKVDTYNSPIVMMPESSALKTKGHDVLLSQAIQFDDKSPIMAPGEMIEGFFGTKLNSSKMSAAARLGSGGKLIFKQEDETEEYHVPVKQPLADPALVMPQHHVSVEQQQALLSQQKPTILTKSKPRPKLLIPKPATSNSNNLSTPDVLKPLTEISTNGFNLLHYVCGVGEDSRTQLTSGKESSVSLQDHDYTNSTIDENVIIKYEPLSPSASDSKLNINTQEASNYKRNFPEDFYESDQEGESIADGDSGSDDWVPGGGKKSSVVGRGGRRSRTSSGAESLEGHDRYRALRDRNNEASRRSRQNRKQRDMEIRRHKAELEKKNTELRVKADRMQAHVEEMRATIMRSIINSRKSS